MYSPRKTWDSRKSQPYDGQAKVAAHKGLEKTKNTDWDNDKLIFDLVLGRLPDR
jgi:hypothetical protein